MNETKAGKEPRVNNGRQWKAGDLGECLELEEPGVKALFLLFSFSSEFSAAFWAAAPVGDEVL